MDIEWEFWHTETQNPVSDFLEEQPEKVQIKFAALMEQLKTSDLPTMMTARHIDKVAEFYEIRVFRDKMKYRILFVFESRRAIALHGFKKKTSKTPSKEISIARERLKKI